MLTRPKGGWTDFSLEGTSEYGLSYVDDIAFEWLDQAIHGLETLAPFCVTGYMEPDRMVCVVSLRRCHVFVEDEDTSAMVEDYAPEEAPVGMIDFCKRLYEDIGADIEGWAAFGSWRDEKEGLEARKQRLVGRLERLKNLIDGKSMALKGSGWIR
ncbi:hypothetical protein [uncultured Rikenella sp.]|uniref:hypothetical protein n=1 Tax=uncultured Rikenella sp. TaxID=368003 RepID=UPI0026293681|nr:hypothetical protein [uncultured Rikenella sp.]